MMRAGAVKSGELFIVSIALCREAAKRYALSPREAETAALEGGLCPSRYERTIGTFGLEGQARLLRSCAAVAGCGGLGGWIIEILARAGVGRLILIDGDIFSENNLNRQLYATEENIGEAKAAAAARRVAAVNSALSVEARTVFINADNGAELLAPASVVLDALDGNDARRELFTLCRRLGIPFIHGAVAGFFGQCAALRPEDSPLWELTEAPDRGIELATGNPPFTPPLIASMQAAAALKILAGVGEIPEKSLFWFDMNRFDMRRLRLK
ncbi:MAG: HesA/MoeB/ThiF family protein [Synergistaceae bacterium]|nr:HesA/MoeB/ThiF family protein [Synergistaceae bacterium]